MKTNMVFLAITCSLLAACGGGGGGENANSGESTQNSTIESVGVFLDSPVKGLWYETPTRSGLTNAQGEFTYLDGERVTFFLGDTRLGITRGAATVTPFSLLDMLPLTKETEISAVLKSRSVSSFDRAINMAAFLQTLDQDSNPDNGIDLGAAHVELSDTTVNLSVKATKFINEPSLETAKNRVGLGARREFNEVALHLYKSLNIRIKSDLVSEVSVSTNAGHSTKTSLEYDDKGKVIVQRSDINNDGIAESEISFSYDDSGNLKAISNTATNTSETLVYDDRKNLVSHFTDNFREQDVQQSFTFNQDNRLNRLELDLGADGDVEATMTYDYDGEGNLTTYAIDQDSDGDANLLASYHYDNDTVVSFVEDSDNDGDPSLDITYNYDSEGKRISQSVRSSTAGLPSNNATFGYDNNGNITRYEQDNDQDGQVDYIESSEYDSNNNRTLYRRDINADGTWDSITQYTYDSDGNRTSMKEDSDGNGTIDKQWSSNYDTAVLDKGWDSIRTKLDAGG